MPDPKTVQMLVLDVDGVLTDGRIVIDEFGREMKSFHVRDGLGIRLWLEAGYEAALISGRSCRAVTHRAEDLGITHVIQGCHDKSAAIQALCTQTGVPADRTAVLGDDLIDLPMMNRVGYPMAVADASPETRAAAAFVTKSPGGHGAVREAIEHLLKAQDRWDGLVSKIDKNAERNTPCLANPEEDPGD